MDVKICDQWNDYLYSFPDKERDIYFTEEYVKLYENDNASAKCIVCEEDGSCMIMPFLRGQIEDCYDFETAYGYGGPIFNDKSSAFVNRALDSTKEFLLSEGFVCGFTRFHPFLENAFLCKDKMDVIFDRKTVTVDLDMNEEDIWKTQITSKNRNMIRKAEKNGLSFEAEYGFESISRFVELYFDTMRRVKAEKFYFFCKDYYEDFCNGLKDESFLAVVKDGENVLGASLFMFYNEYGHYHLAGSMKMNSSLGINNYLLWNVIKELKKNGVKRFHLGGGRSSAPDDSLFRFKKSFSKNESDFYIGKWILDKDRYKDICCKWERENPDLIERYGNRLLKYKYVGEG